MYKMADLKGSKTEANLQAAFAGESQAHTKYHTLLQKQKKKDMFKSMIFSWKLPKTKENMQKSGINCYMMKKFQTQLKT